MAILVLLQVLMQCSRSVLFRGLHSLSISGLIRNLLVSTLKAHSTTQSFLGENYLLRESRISRATIPSSVVLKYLEPRDRHYLLRNRVILGLAISCNLSQLFGPLDPCLDCLKWIFLGSLLLHPPNPYKADIREFDSVRINLFFFSPQFS
jgi:hypothetical protein